MGTPRELLAPLENEALEERKRRSAGKRAVIYDVMFLKAKEGDVQAMKEYLDRTEGKVPNKNDITITGEITLLNSLKAIVDDVDGETWGFTQRKRIKAMASEEPANLGKHTFLIISRNLLHNTSTEKLPNPFF